MKRIHPHMVDPEAEQLPAEIATSFSPKDADQRAALRSLQGWRGDMAGDSQPAAIFNVWIRYLRKSLFEKPLRGYWNEPEQAAFLSDLGGSVSLETIREILAGNSPWCGRNLRSNQETCAEVLESSLRSALVEIRKLTGNQAMSSWRWNELQKTLYIHRPFSEAKLLKVIFERKIGNGGSPNTVNTAAGSFLEKDGFSQEVGPSFRQIFRLGADRVVHEYMNSTGQSGNVISRHYADMVEPFHNVQYFKFGSGQPGVGDGAN
jgi:penicillin G amidase